MKISKLTINNFRGVAGELIIDFRPAHTNSPNSLLLLGDNGTGKSSIVDAIEFALQGTIRSTLDPFSLATDKLPKIVVSFSDNTNYQRSYYKNELGEIYFGKDRHQKFSISPFALRRSDILKFIESNDANRQVLLFQYFSKPSTKPPTHESDSNKLSDVYANNLSVLSKKRLTLKQARREAAEELAQKLSISVEEIPFDKVGIDTLVRDKIHNGFTKKQREAAQYKGITIKTKSYLLPYVKKIKEFSEEIRRLNNDINEIQKPRSSFQKTLIKNLLLDAAVWITQSFKELTSANFIDKIELEIGNLTEVSLGINLHLKNGRICSAHSILSEANLDLLSLLVFLSIVREATSHGQTKLLILDDVMQSVDSSIRVAIIEYILKEFSDWQLIITAHDRLWYSQLQELFRKANHPFVEQEIIRWRFDSGPVISQITKDIDELLIEAMGTGNISIICSQGGLLLEAICNRLSWVLPISVTRRKEDKYTLGDLWPGIHKVLKKTNIKDISEKVDKWLHLRNLVGAHYNEWARSLPASDALNFGEAIIDLLWSVKCHNCFRWIEAVSNQAKIWSCKCGKISITN